MGKLASGVQKRTRNGKSRLIIDFRYRDKDGRVQRFRRDARIQSRSGAEAEARRLMEIAHSTGTLDLRAEAPTLRAFVEETFKPLYKTKYRAGTWKRYEGLLSQGLVDELGEKHLDEISASVVRGFMALLAKRGIQARGPINFLRTILTAAVETGALEAMPVLPKPPPPGRKLPSSPTPEEVEAMLDKTDGWLRAAIALAAFAGLRQGEVRALEVRDVDVAGGIITVRRALSENEPVAPKSGHERVVPIWPRLAEALAPALRGKLPAARVVVNQSGAHTVATSGVDGAARGPASTRAPASKLPRAPALLPVRPRERRSEPGSGARTRRALEAAHHATLRACDWRRPPGCDLTPPG